MARHAPAPTTALGRWRRRLQTSGHSPPPTKLLLAVLTAGLVLAGTIQPGAAWEIFITPAKDVAKFKSAYTMSLSVGYPDGSAIKDELHDKPPQRISKTYTLQDDPDVRVIADKLNARIAANNSQARITDLSVTYHTGVKHSSILPPRVLFHTAVIMTGELGNLVIAEDEKRILVDMGWRDLSIPGEIMLDGNEINTLSPVVKKFAPTTHQILSGTDAKRFLDEELVIADPHIVKRLGEWPSSRTSYVWPSNVEKYEEDTSNFAETVWTNRACSGWCVADVVIHTTVRADYPYDVTFGSGEVGEISLLGYAKIIDVEGVEVASVTPKKPDPAEPAAPAEPEPGAAGPAARGCAAR